MQIKFSGQLSAPEIKVPGWAGSATGDTCQPWHFKQFTDASAAGVELLYPHEDIAVPEVTPPFTRINDYWFMLEMDMAISTPEEMSLLVLPHYRFYTDTEWSTPVPVATMIETDWWPRLTILFKMPPKGYVTKFQKNEPFAQAIVVPRNSLGIEKMTDKEEEISQAAKLYTHKVVKNLATRHWVTSTGFVQHNLYEVLSHLHRQHKLPEDYPMMPWFKIKKQKNTSINGVNLGQKPQVEVVVEEEKEPEPKPLPRKVFHPRPQQKP